MTTEEKREFREMLRKMGEFVAADGKINWSESSELLTFVRPFASTDADCAELVKVLQEVRADAIITAAESKRIIDLVSRISSDPQ